MMMTYHHKHLEAFLVIRVLIHFSRLPEIPPHLIGFGSSELRETIPGAREEFHSIHGTSGIDFLGLQLVP